MNNYTIETKVKNGKVILKDLPFKDKDNEFKRMLLLEFI